MSALSIRPPFSAIEIPQLLRTPVALFEDDAEKFRGRLLFVHKNPGKYGSVISIDVGNNDILSLGYNKDSGCWTYVREDPAGHWCNGKFATPVDLRHAISLVPATSV